MLRSVLSAVVVLACVVGLVGVLNADAKDDLSRAKSDYDSFKSKTDDLKRAG